MAGFPDEEAIGAPGGSASGDGATDDLMEQAGAVRDQVDVPVDQYGDIAPDQVEETIEQVSDQVEDVVPGDGE